MMSFALSLHFLALGVMLGVIWLVQIFLYPGFRSVPESHFVLHHQRHAALISRVVGPAMLAEGATGLWLWTQRRDLFWTGQLALMGVNILLTFAYAVSWHAQLSKGKDLLVIEKIIRINAVRVACWSLRAACLMVWAAREFRFG